MEALALRDLLPFLLTRPPVVPLVIPITTLDASARIALRDFHEQHASIALLASNIFHLRARLAIAMQSVVASARAIAPSAEYAWHLETRTPLSDVARFAALAAGSRCWFLHQSPPDSRILDAISKNKDLAQARHLVGMPWPPALLGLNGRAAIAASSLALVGDGVPNVRNSAAYPRESLLPPVHRLARQGGYHGFADYTALRSTYRPGGGIPASITIHATFEDASATGTRNAELKIAHCNGRGRGPNEMIRAAQAELRARPDAVRAVLSTVGGTELLNSGSASAAAFKRFAIAHHVEYMTRRFVR